MVDEGEILLTAVTVTLQISGMLLIKCSVIDSIRILNIWHVEPREYLDNSIVVTDLAKNQRIQSDPDPHLILDFWNHKKIPQLVQEIYLLNKLLFSYLDDSFESLKICGFDRRKTLD